MRLQILRIGFVAAILSSAARADDWPQWLGPQRDGVWRETGIVETFPAGGPKLLWRTPVGAGYSGPAVAGGKVYITDRVLASGAKNPDNPFATVKKGGLPAGGIAGSERVHCIDAKSGKIEWTHSYECRYTVSYAAGPRTTPIVHDGKVYTLGTQGDLLCLNAADGKVLWSRNLPKDYSAEPPLWGFAANPLLDGDKLICLVGGEGAAVVAFDRNTGKELWKSLDAPDVGYNPPVIFEAGGKRQLIIWLPQSVNSLDPETGKPYWKHDWQIKAGLTAPTVRKDGDHLFLTAFYNGSLMLKLDHDRPAATVAWKRGGADENHTDALHSIIPTPFIKDGHIYGVCSYGQLRCIKAENGERVWETFAATTSSGKPLRWANAFIIPNGDRYFLANELGDLIIAKLSPKGYEEISRAHLLEPTNGDASGMRRDKGNVIWSHPAFADKCCFMRNDKEIIGVSLEK